MQNLVAQVTSSLLQFPEVTIKALEEDEINIESVLRGKFVTGRNGLACLACGPQLEVINSVTCERLSAYHFSGVTERPPTVLAVKEFSWQKKTGLLVGLVETEGSVLCLYDVGISRVVKAVVLPGTVTAVEPIINHGGASASTQHLHQSLRWFFGVAAVVTDVGHVLLIDLCMDDVSSNQDELDASDLEVMSRIPGEIPKLREAATRERRHLCLQLLAPSGTTISTLSYISRTNQLAVGFSDGYLSLWNMKTLRREYHVQIEGGKVPVYAVTFQEPENDPRNCCYLWAVQSSQSGGDVSLHLLQLAFGDRKCLASGQILYEGLEYCEERYSLDLSADALSLRGQTNSTKLLGCQTIEKFRVHGEREDGVHEVTSPDTSVSVFSWQVNTYGQGKPSTYLGVFDINRWYQAQMPDSLRPGQFLRNCSYFAFWSLEAVVNMTPQDSIFDIVVHERSLSRGVPPSYPPPEQFYYPSTYNFDATCLLNSGIVHITCTGFQKETLHFLKKSGPALNEAIPDGYNRCLVAGLLSPRLADVQPSNLSQEEQLQAVLSTAVETSSLGLLTSCIKQWTAEEQPRSAANLRFVLEWTWNKVVYTKREFDRLCAPLFDGSCNFIDPQTLQSLQHGHLRLSNLTTVLNCFITEAQELTKQGLIDLTNKQAVTRLLTQYASVVLWFCRSGLLPDTPDETMQLNRPYYNYQLIQQYYADRRKKLEHLSRGKWNTSSLMIDGMISQFGDGIGQLFSRDEGSTGKYPPASLHALLDLYLLENVDETSKHAITIYLLLDIMYSFPDKPDSSIESFPTAFCVPCGLVKLIQGFWLLDHNDYQSSMDCILHPATSRLMTWQHTQVIEALMCQGDHRQAHRYIEVMKPPMATSKEVKLHMTVLLTNRYIVEAWNVQRLHASPLNVEELLKHMYEACQELGLMEDLLKFNFTNIEQEYLHRFLQTSGGVQNQELLLVHHLQRANYIPALQLNQSLKTNHMNDCDRRLRERAVARNSILDQYGKILPRVQRTLANERAKPYSLSSLVWREVARPKPLSTVAKQAAPGSVISKASFISNVLSKIKEVSVANENREFSPYKSFVIEEPSPITTPRQDLDISDAFVGTPITKSRTVSRLLDSVVHSVLVEPSPQAHSSSETNCQTPRKTSAVWTTSSPVRSSLRKTAQLRSIVKAAEFSLLETPLIVRRAKALAASTTSSGFTGFTPQSILRSSVRSTPMASPSASPGRSITPPLRSKETKISFMEEMSNKWAKRVLAADRDVLVESPVLKSTPDTLWSGSRVKITSFSLNSPAKDHEQMDESSSGIQGRGPIKMDVCRETSNVSAKSDQTTLEYHDAPAPDDFEEDVITLTNKPLHLNTEEPVDKEIQEAIVTEQIAEMQPTEMLESEELKVFGEEAEIEYLSLPENGPKVLDQSTAVQDTELEPVDERVLETSDTEGSQSEIGDQASESSVTDAESVISIDDSDDIVSTHSDNQIEEAPEEELNGDVAVEILAEKVLLVEEELASTTTLAHCLEVQIIEEKEVDMHVAEPEPEMVNYQELTPAGTVELDCNIENIIHHYSCEFTDVRDSVESEIDEVEEEHFISQNNFTLILEGDAGEEEVEELEQDNIDQPEPAALDSPEAYCAIIDENVDNYKSAMNHEELAAKSVSPVCCDPDTKIMETFPYVPEPIKVAIAENLLDVINDNVNKEFTAEINSDSLYENEPVSNSRAASKTPMKRATQTNAEDVDIDSVAELVTPPKKPDEQKMSDPSVIPVLPNVDKSALRRPLTPRRSVRKASKLLEISYVDSEEPPLPTTLRRSSRKAKENNTEDLKNALSTVQDEGLSVSTRRITRKVKNAAFENPERTQMEETLVEETLAKQPSTPTRARRGKESTSREQENNEGYVDQKFAMPLTPTRTTRSSRNLTLELENVTLSQHEEANENEHQILTLTRGRRGKRVVNELVKHFELNSSQPANKADIDAPLSPKRASRRWTMDRSEYKTIEENLKAPEQTLDTPRKRYRRTIANKIDTEEPADVSAGNFEELAVPRSSTRRTHTSIIVNQSRKGKLLPAPDESLEERLQLPKSQDRLHHTEAAKVYGEQQSTRVTRTRSSNVSSFPDVSALGNESFVFSIPTTKLKKAKADQVTLPVLPVQLEPDMSSLFVFSPAATRTRRTTRSSAPEMLKAKDLQFQEANETRETNVPEVPTLRNRRGRPPKHKTKKDGKTDNASWSPPPVEIKLISPPESPAVGASSTKITSEEGKVTEKNPLRRNRRRLMLNLSKPVTRRKMR